ncbi:MAG: hypothetical protein H3C41_08695 [Bacteroidales bacterium]|nr:hypothetical protein [Bacteroidales bacterium]
MNSLIFRYFIIALKRNFLLALVVLLFFGSGRLQGQPTEAYVAFSGGLSIPLAAYSARQLPEGCFTMPGPEVVISAGIPLWRQFGAKAMAGYYIHPVDVSALGYQKLQADPFLSDLTIRSEPYRILAFMGGPFFQLHASRKLRLQGMPVAGWFSSRSPYQLHKTSYFMPGPAFYEITTSLDRSFAWGLSALCSYPVATCYEVGLSLDYLYTKAQFRFRRPDGTERTDPHPISMFNIHLNLLFKLPDFHNSNKQ